MNLYYCFGPQMSTYSAKSDILCPKTNDTMQKTNPRLQLYNLGLLSCEWMYSWLDGSAIMSVVGVDHGPWTCLS